MATSPDFLDLVLEMLAPLGVAGTLTSRAMFGGTSLALDGMTFALIADDILYFKADADNRARYEAAGLSPFVPFPDQPHKVMAYYPAPEEAMEDGPALLPWARLGIDAALRAAAKKRSRRKAK